MLSVARVVSHSEGSIDIEGHFCEPCLSLPKLLFLADTLTKYTVLKNYRTSNARLENRRWVGLGCFS